MELGKGGIFFATILIVGLSFFGGYMLSKNNEQNNPPTQVLGGTQQQAQPTPLPITFDTIKGLFSRNLIKFGNGDKKLLIVEVSDPSCPFCHVAGGSNKTIGAKMGQQFVLTADGGSYMAPIPEMKKLVDLGKADMVWIYSPGHGNGEMGTKALYCAYDQGKYWQANDLLMSDKGYDLLNTTIKNDKTKSQEMVDFLASVVDKKAMKECLDSGKYESRLTEETALATQLGVSGTPGFYLNTTNFAGAYGWSDMQPTADAALK